MRCVAWARIVLFGACVAVAGEAVAGVKVSEKTRSYEITGRTARRCSHRWIAVAPGTAS